MQIPGAFGSPFFLATALTASLIDAWAMTSAARSPLAGDAADRPRVLLAEAGRRRLVKNYGKPRKAARPKGCSPRNAAAGRRGALLLAAFTTAAIFVFAVEISRQSAMRKAVASAEHYAEKVAAETAIEIEKYFDEEYTAAGNLGLNLLSVLKYGRPTRDLERFAKSMLEARHSRIAVAYEIYDRRGALRHTGGETISEDAPPRMADDPARPYISDVYEIPPGGDGYDDNRYDWYANLLGSSFSNPYAFSAAPPSSDPAPTKAVTLEVPIVSGDEIVGYVSLQRSLKPIGHMLDQSQNDYDDPADHGPFSNYAYIANPALYTHKGTAAYRAPYESAAASRALDAVRDGASSIVVTEEGGGGAGFLFAAHAVRIGETGESWLHAQEASIAAITMDARESHNRMLFFGLLAIAALAGVAFVKTQKPRGEGDV